MPSSALRTRLAQIEVLPGRPAQNTAHILECIRAARKERVELIVFPEMSVPGYLIGDAWERDAFLRECEACAVEIRDAARDIIVVFGTVGIDRRKKNEDGRVRKYNALYVAGQGRFIPPAKGPYDFVVKALLPNYREFDDSRHFSDVRKLAVELDRRIEDLVSPVVTPSGLSLGCMLCEDAWDTDYASKPLDILCAQGAHILVNCSASPFTRSKNHKRGRVFSAHSTRHGRPFLYVNNVGIQNNGKTVYAFDGSSCAYDGFGHAVQSGRLFDESFTTFDMPTDGRPFGEPTVLKVDGIDTVCNALLYGTRQFMRLCGVRKVVVGISGGIDSAVVACLHSRLLAPDNLLLVNMPGPHTSATTRSLARELVSNLGCLYAEVSINESVALTTRQVSGLTVRNGPGSLMHRLHLSPFMTENVQARDRSSRVLAAVAAAFEGVFTCNANKSEATVGYTTLYGDLSGYLASIADLWKGDVYELAGHLNTRVFERPVIPAGTIEIVPSAELSPEQDVDRQKGDPLIYPYHDCLFRSWVEFWDRATPEDVLEWHLDGSMAERLGMPNPVSEVFESNAAFVADLERWWDLYQGMGVAKRIQAPPVLAVSRRAYGFDHREAQMGPVYTARYSELKDRVLAMDKV
jgi:NAD+ synthase (glutamine-hydrolysing)